MWKAHNTNGGNLQANILGQLEAGKSPFQAVNLISSLYHSRFRRFTAGTPYFDGYIAMVSHQESLMLSYPVILISLPTRDSPAIEHTPKACLDSDRL